jgi:hypothetical protein
LSDPPTDRKSSEYLSTQSTSEQEREDKNKYPEKYGRIAAIDFGRGFGMFIVLAVHLANYWGFPHLPESPSGFNSNYNLIIQIIMFPFVLLGSWASIFALLTGASTAYIMYYQINIKKVDINKRLKQSFISAFVLLIIHYIYVFFFIYPTYNIEGFQQQGFIPGSLKGEGWKKPTLSFLFIAGPLSMIAFSDLIVTWVCGKIWRKQKSSEKILDQTLVTFLILGLLFVFLAEPIKTWLIPVLYTTYENHQYFYAMVLTWFVGTKHCIFPFVGYAFFGGILSLTIYKHHNNRKQLQRIGYSLSLFFGILAIWDAIKNGIPELIGLYHPYFLYMLNLSLQLWIATLVLSSFDMIPMDQRKNYARYRFLVPFRRLSTISLTLFLTEQTIAAIYTRISIWLFPHLMDSIVFIMTIWVPFYMYCWFEAIRIWEKNNFKYSIEWWLARIFGGKNKAEGEDILNIEKNIYQNSGFVNREEYYAIKQGVKIKDLTVSSNINS